MDNFLIDVPMPSMGATVNELTVVSLKTQPGDRVTKGQKVAELESDKSVFDFESPCDGIIQAVMAKPGEVKPAGAPFLQIETADASLRHLEHQETGDRRQTTDAPSIPTQPAGEVSGSARPPVSRPLSPVIWTPRATKLAQEAGLDPAKVMDIEATGPGGRVSGDDVTRYLASRKS